MCTYICRYKTAGGPQELSSGASSRTSSFRRSLLLVQRKKWSRLIMVTSGNHQEECGEVVEEVGGAKDQERAAGAGDGLQDCWGSSWGI